MGNKQHFREDLVCFGALEQLCHNVYGQMGPDGLLL